MTLGSTFNPHVKNGARVFSAERPSSKKKYFGPSSPSDPTRDSIAVVVPCYNEGPKSLQKTLMSLSRAEEAMRKALISEGHTPPQLHVLVIQDGWQKADAEMINYIETLFPPHKCNEEWKTTLLEWQKTDSSHTGYNLLLQSEDWLQGTVNVAQRWSESPSNERNVAAKAIVSMKSSQKILVDLKGILDDWRCQQPMITTQTAATLPGSPIPLRSSPTASGRPDAKFLDKFKKVILSCKTLAKDAKDIADNAKQCVEEIQRAVNGYETVNPLDGTELEPAVADSSLDSSSSQSFKHAVSAVELASAAISVAASAEASLDRQKSLAATVELNSVLLSGAPDRNRSVDLDKGITLGENTCLALEIAVRNLENVKVTSPGLASVAYHLVSLTSVTLAFVAMCNASMADLDSAASVLGADGDERTQEKLAAQQDTLVRSRSQFLGVLQVLYALARDAEIATRSAQARSSASLHSDVNDRQDRDLVTAICSQVQDISNRLASDTINTLAGALDEAVNLATNIDGLRMREAAGSVNRPMNLSFFIKADNRKKHNSHEWFLKAFANEVNAKYVFCTDCSTLFEPTMLLRLYQKISSDSKISAVTCRQRVMTRQMQETDAFDERTGEEVILEQGRFTFWTPWDIGKENLMDFWLRQVQRFDFESAFESFMGTFSILRVLPVTPGPCGLYRYESLTTKSPAASALTREVLGEDHIDGECVYSPLDWYFAVVCKRNPGMILGNLQIAEDRILSYASVLTTKTPGMCQAVVPEAVFFFEAETNLETLFKQRRRWINGTWAGYVYLLFYSQLVGRAPMAAPRRALIWILLLCQALMFLGVALSQSVFLIALLFAERALIGEETASQVDLVNLIFYVNVGLYILLVVRSLANAYEEWLFKVSLLLNTTIVFFTIIATIKMSLEGDMGYTDSPIDSNGHLRLTSGHLIFGSIIILVTPILISMLHDFRATYHMLTAFIPFLLFQPTMIATIGAYAFARTHDLTWGNRPVDGDQKAQKAAENSAPDKLRARSYTLCMFIVLMNIAIVFIVDTYSSQWVVVFVLSLLFLLFGTIQLPFSVLFFLHHFVRVTIVNWILGLVSILGHCLLSMYNCIRHCVCWPRSGPASVTSGPYAPLVPPTPSDRLSDLVPARYGSMSAPPRPTPVSPVNPLPTAATATSAAPSTHDFYHAPVHHRFPVPSQQRRQADGSPRQGFNSFVGSSA